MRLYYYRCSSGHAFTCEEPQEAMAVPCPQCNVVCGWHRVVYWPTNSRHDDRNITDPGSRSPGWKCQDPVEQKFANVARKIKEASQRQMARREHQWTAKEKRDHQRMRDIAEQQSSRSEAKLMADVPTKLYYQRIRESGDPEYWDRNNHENLKREGVWLGRK